MPVTKRKTKSMRDKILLSAIESGNWDRKKRDQSMVCEKVNTPPA